MPAPATPSRSWQALLRPPRSVSPRPAGRPACRARTRSAPTTCSVHSSPSDLRREQAEVLAIIADDQPEPAGPYEHGGNRHDAQPPLCLGVAALSRRRHAIVTARQDRDRPRQCRQQQRASAATNAGNSHVPRSCNGAGRSNIMIGAYSPTAKRTTRPSLTSATRADRTRGASARRTARPRASGTARRSGSSSSTR